ncbi:hypothetical protein KIL84_021212 [Mauremys mutica]|uniref:Uncharacterized protein n=1 Tax=Mauremys mutica TaxID=74926 RepID=A0A9D3XB77_9SAUR|nr:hypothetical protein KIL84_021212 [Mauremys mutica]
MGDMLGLLATRPSSSLRESWEDRLPHLLPLCRALDREGMAVTPLCTGLRKQTPLHPVETTRGTGDAGRQNSSPPAWEQLGTALALITNAKTLQYSTPTACSSTPSNM